MKNVGAKPRIEALGIPVVPVFLKNEPDYTGQVDYVRLVGMLTGREREADAHVAMVARNVAALKEAAAGQPTRSVLSAWFADDDRWNPVIRNAAAKMLRDANGRNPFEGVDDPDKDSRNKVSTEELIARGANADCWIMRDSHSAPFTDRAVLSRFKGYRGTDACSPPTA